MGESNLLGHAERRRVDLGFPLNTQTLTKTKSHNILGKFTSWCQAAFIAIVGRRWPAGCGTGCGLDTLD